MDIGIIGSGKIGATVGRLWADAGHRVRFGSRDPAAAAGRVAWAEVDTQEAVAAWATILFTAAPYGLWPDLAARLAPHVAGKLVMDAANPYPPRDGAFAQAALDAAHGSGVPVARLLPGAHYVRAFNSVFWETLAREAHRAGERLAIPLAGDDPASLDQAATLVTEAGFAPVIVGPLVDAASFDVGAAAYDNPQTASELERLLGLLPPG